MTTDRLVEMVNSFVRYDGLCEGCMEDEVGYSCAECRHKAADRIIEMLTDSSEKLQQGECRTCVRNADNGGYYEPEHRTRCPIQEHYALLLDGYCHLYEPYKGGDTE